MVNIKTITLRLDDELHQKLKIYSAVIKENMQYILIRLIEKELREAEKEENKEK